MNRFQIEHVTISDLDGEDRVYEVIVDNNSARRLKTPFGESSERYGFLRCHGKHYVGTFGRDTDVYGGNADDVYYASVHEFDGVWDHCYADAQGSKVVTADSGVGKLFAALENFCEAQGVASKY